MIHQSRASRVRAWVFGFATAGSALSVPSQLVAEQPIATAPGPSETAASAPSIPASPVAAQPISAAVAARPCYRCGQASSSEDLQASMRGAAKGLFYANDYSYLASPLYDGPFFPGDSFKGKARGRLDLGGEFRSRYHSENNFRGLGLNGVDDEFWLTRTRLFANYRVTEHVRFFGEYLYADSGGETNAPRPIEENRGEMQNLFADVKLFDTGDTKIVGRAGRQELLFGAQRLISPLDWANTRRTFDGYRATVSTSDSNLDLFYTNPVNRVPATGGTNKWDSSNNDQSFYGGYLSTKTSTANILEAYYLGYDDNNLNFSFHTLGSRIAGKGEAFLYEMEGGVQFGDNADGSDHGAGFFTAGLGRQLDFSVCHGKSWKPTLWVWYDWASGGNSQLVAPGDNGFHHLFPLGHKYLGFIDLFGRRNINDVNLQLITPMGDRVKFLMWYHYMFLDQATTPYSVVMTPYNTSTPAVDKELGHEIDLLWTITLNPRNSMLVGYSHFHAGDYYETPGVAFDGNADFFYTQYQLRF